MKQVLKTTTLFVMLFFTVAAIAQTREGGITGNSNFMNIHMLTKHLDLTDEQVTAIKAIMEEQKEAITSLRSTVADDRDAMLKAVREIKDETEAKILALLTPEQLAKYNELLEKQKGRDKDNFNTVQGSGGGYIGYLNRYLDLTDEQAEAIETILEQQRTEIASIRRSAGGENVDRDAIRTDVERIRTQTETGIKALLTPEQLEIYSQILDRRNNRGGGKMLNPKDFGGGKKIQEAPSKGSKKQ